MNYNFIESNSGIVIPKKFKEFDEGVVTNKIVSYFDMFNNVANITSLDEVFSFEKKRIFLDDQEMFYSTMERFALPFFKQNKILPFGSDAGGYFFCFDYRENSTDPKIVLWIRDNPEGYDIAYLADSFEEFLNSLKSAEEVNM